MLTNLQRQTLLALAPAYIWWKPPEEAIKYPERVIAQIMDLGTVEDLVLLHKAFDEGMLVNVLDNALAGWFHPKSWSYWHIKFHKPIPPLPRRIIDGHVLPEIPNIT